METSENKLHQSLPVAMISFRRLFRKLLIACMIATPILLAALVTYSIAIIYPPADGVWLKNDALLGGDFLAFYTGGTLFRETPDRLYDLGHQVTFQKDLLGGSLGSLSSPLPFVYPPLVAAIFSPLSYLTLEHAFYLTAIIALLSSLFALLTLARFYQLPFKHSYLVVVISAVGFIPFYLNTVFGAQLPWLGIAIFSTFSILLNKKQYVLAGAILAFGYYKPPLFLLAALYFAIRLGAPFIKGALLSALVLTMLSIATIGVDGLLNYVEIASTYTYGHDFMPGVRHNPGHGTGIFALMTSFFSSGALNYALYAVLCSVILTLAVYKRIRMHAITPVEISLVITSSVGLSVWCMKYDLAILLVPFMLFASDVYCVHSRIKYLVIAIISGFYFEYFWREESLLGMTVNLSSFLFLFLIATVYVLAARAGRVCVREA